VGTGTDLLGWASDDRASGFLLTTSGEQPGSTATEVRLVHDGKVIDMVEPDAQGLAAVGGPGGPDGYSIEVVGRDGSVVSTCARDPKLDSLFLCKA